MLEQLLLAAGAAGLDLRMNRARRELRVRLSGTDAAKQRAALYPLLAAFESSFLVTAAGAPACLAPDAFEHFSWPLGEKGPFKFIKVCAGCALKGRCPGVNSAWAGPGSEELAPVLTSPSELVIELNKNCNLACRACFGRGGEELPRAAAERALREAASLGIGSVRFTGGEPLLHPGLPHLLRLARELGFYTLLNTNAVLFTPAKAKTLKGLVDNALVSLPGADEAAHAAASGKAGALALKAAAVKRLRASGVKVVRAGTVVSRELALDFSRWHKAVSRLGFDIWELYRPMMTPRALAAAPEYKVSRRDLVRLARAVAEQRGGARAVLANPVPFCALPPAARPYALGARFDDGWTRLVLDAGGEYKPSYPSALRLGRRLGDAWNSPFLRKTRAGAWLPAACARCAMLSVCLAGSRYQAGLAGNPFGRDPWMTR